MVEYTVFQWKPPGEGFARREWSPNKFTNKYIENLSFTVEKMTYAKVQGTYDNHAHCRRLWNFRMFRISNVQEYYAQHKARPQTMEENEEEMLLGVV